VGGFEILLCQSDGSVPTRFRTQAVSPVRRNRRHPRRLAKERTGEDLSGSAETFMNSLFKPPFSMTGQALGSSLYRLLKNLFFSLAPADRNQKRNNFHGRFERFEAISEMMGVFQQPVNLT